MAIDGRTISKQAKPVDAYESVGVRIISAALIVVPIVLVVWFAYVSGTWMGGWTMGVLSVLSALATVAIVWIFLKVRRKRR
jgi:membrane protein implicated in regulation of membrane protease activity